MSLTDHDAIAYVWLRTRKRKNLAHGRFPNRCKEAGKVIYREDDHWLDRIPDKLWGSTARSPD